MKTIFLFVAAVAVTCSYALGADVSAPDFAKGGRLDKIQIRKDRPRIWLDAERIAWLKEKTKGKSIDEVKALAGTSAMGNALVYAMTGDSQSGRSAIDAALKAADNEQGMVLVAISYDWCYPLLSDSEKDTLKTRMIASAKKAIAFTRNWRSFHNGLYSTAWPVTAEVIALYGDDPYAEEALAYLKPQLEDVLKTFDILFADGEWCEGVDYNRHSTYEAMRFFWAIKTATGIDVMAASPHMKNTGMFVMYGAKGDGLNLPINDNDFPFLGWWEREALLLAAAEYKDGYCQSFLNHCPVLDFQTQPRNKWMELLWYDPNLAEKPLAELPMSRIFRGMGLVLARTGWSWDTKEGRAGGTWVSFRCGDYYGDHCHYDMNRFEIYYKGPQAIDSGRYDSDWDHYGDELLKKSQFFNYYQRTIAHNTILVYDPNEKFEMPIVNDGGQRQLLLKDGNRNVPEDYDQGTFTSDNGIGTCDWATNPGRWETGDVLGYKATSDYMYACGDATAAYSAGKMKSFVRQLVFVKPNIVVVFDRVVSTKPEFKKTWLLHSVNEPQIAADGSSFESANGGGRIVCVPLLPEKAQLAKVGVPDNGFLVGGIEFKYGLDSAVNEEPLHFVESITGEQIGETPGKWRVEESPAKPSLEDYFLNVMLVTDRESKEVPHVACTVTDNDISVKISTAGKTAATVSFAKGDKPRATLRIENDGKVVSGEEMPLEIALEAGRPQ